MKGMEPATDIYVQLVSKLDRKHCRMLVGLLTNLHYMPQKVRRAKTASCSRCGAEKETLAHKLFENSALEKIRIQTLGFVRMDPDQVKEAWLSSIVALGKGAKLLKSHL